MCLELNERHFILLLLCFQVYSVTAVYVEAVYCISNEQNTIVKR